MKIFNKILTAILCAFPLFWQGCSDDSFEIDRNEADFQGISVQIPYVAEGTQLSASTKAALTRAGQPVDFDSKEAVINNLYVFAFSNGFNGKSDAVEVTKADLDAWTDKSKPHKVNLPLEIGEYHIYAIANVKLDNFKDMEEEDVRDYQFAAQAGTLSDFENGLPMSCSPSQITKSNGYYVKVESNATTSIEAKMKFAVSKVRLSMVNALGDFTVNGLTVGKLADMLNLCIDSQKSVTTEKTGTVSIDGLYYDLTSVNDKGKYVVDNLTNGTQNPSDTKAWIWQSVFYIPERLIPNTTEMTLSLSNGSSKTYKLGEKDSNNNYTVNRSQYYRYYIEPNSGEITLEVLTWDPESIIATLGGPVNLNVDKTDLGVISGANTAVLKYNSNVTVDYESPKIDGLDVFILESGESDEQYKSFVVKVNPKLGIRSEGELQEYHYFYLTAGPLRKKIVATPDLSPYLIVTPESYTVVMKEIANEVTYQVEYSYSTNLKTLNYGKGEGDNDNTGDDLRYYMSTSDGMSEDEVRPGSSVNLQQNGRIIVVFNEPYNPTKFQKESNIAYKFIASQPGQTSLSETVRLNIIPNLNGYRLWFRDVDDSWDDVHIYIYQPLQWNNNGTLVDVKCYRDENYEGKPLEDAVLYSVTGKKTFKGWDTCNIQPGKDDNWGGVYAYKDLRFGNNIDLGNNTHGKRDQEQYYYQTDFLDKWRNGISCEACTGDDYARVWPGIQMKKQEGGKQDKWWYIDIPPICEPGKALIMFTRGHGTNNDDSYHRYPRHLVPGIPLYDFPDREGWMKYDPKKGVDGNGNEFVDDQPEFGNEDVNYTYSVHGQIFGNSNWSTEDMTNVNGKWVIEKDMVSGSFGIKACVNGEQKQWIQRKDDVLNTNGSNVCVIGNDDNKNFYLSQAGKYKFVFDPDAMTLTVTGTSTPVTDTCKLAGQVFDGSSWNNGVDMAFKDGYWSITRDLKKGAFTIVYNGKHYKYGGDVTSYDQWISVNTSNDDSKLTQDGNYTIYFDAVNFKMKVVKNGGNSGDDNNDGYYLAYGMGYTGSSSWTMEKMTPVDKGWGNTEYQITHNFSENSNFCFIKIENGKETLIQHPYTGGDTINPGNDHATGSPGERTWWTGNTGTYSFYLKPWENKVYIAKNN